MRKLQNRSVKSNKCILITYCSKVFFSWHQMQFTVCYTIQRYHMSFWSSQSSIWQKWRACLQNYDRLHTWDGKAPCSSYDDKHPFPEPKTVMTINTQLAHMNTTNSSLLWKTSSSSIYCWLRFSQSMIKMLMTCITGNFSCNPQYCLNGSGKSQAPRVQKLVCCTDGNKNS